MTVSEVLSTEKSRIERESMLLWINVKDSTDMCEKGQ